MERKHKFIKAALCALTYAVAGLFWQLSIIVGLGDSIISAFVAVVGCVLISQVILRLYFP